MEQFAALPTSLSSSIPPQAVTPLHSSSLSAPSCSGNAMGDSGAMALASALSNHVALRELHLQ